MIIRALSNPLEKYSALLWPKACSSSGGRQRPQRRHRGDEVDHRLGRVGKETDGPRKIIGPEFEPYGNHSSRYREHSVAARRPAVRYAPLRHRRLTRGDAHLESARASMNVGVAANTSTFYHLPDKLSHKPRDSLLPTL